MKARNISDGSINDITFYPYQEKTLQRINNHNRNIVLYGRQMGLSTILVEQSLRDLSSGKTVLYITLKSAMNKDVIDRINLNIFDNSAYYVDKNCIRNGNRSHIDVLSFGSIDIDNTNFDDYDTIILDNAQFFSERPLKKLLEELEDFDGKLILSTSGSNYFRGSFYELYKNDSTYHKVTARRFIHPSFNKEWYDYTVSMMGRKAYRLGYECRF